MNTTLDTLVAELATTPDIPLRFEAEGVTIRPDYHVTEIRSAQVRGIDCGARQSAWHETIVELLDGPERSKGRSSHMITQTFVKIAKRCLEGLPRAGSARLIFEYGPGNGPVKKYEVERVRRSESGWTVDLNPIRAACKPALDAMRISDRPDNARREPAAVRAETTADCCGHSRGVTACCTG